MSASGMNETGRAGHHERNKIEGQGEANATGVGMTSTGFGGDMDDIDPDTPPPEDLSGRADPSMRGAVAQPATHDPKDSSFAPGGDKTSVADVDAEAMLRQTADREAASRH